MILSCDFYLSIQQMEFLGLTSNGNFSLLARGFGFTGVYRFIAGQHAG